MVRICRAILTGACVWSALTESRSDETGSVETREKHFVFAKAPEMSMARVIQGVPTGIKAAFRFYPSAKKPQDRKGILELRIDDQQFEFPAEQILNQTVAVPGTTWTLNRAKFLPDFRLENKETVSASDQPNNPALVFEISGQTAPSGKPASQKCEHEEGACDHTQQKACCPPPGTKSDGVHADVAGSNGGVLFGTDQKPRLAIGSESRKAPGARSDATPKVTRDIVWVLEWRGLLVLGASLFMVFQYRRWMRLNTSASTCGPSATVLREPRISGSGLSPEPMIQPGSGRAGTN
jgi:hypothetical protein